MRRTFVRPYYWEGEGVSRREGEDGMKRMSVGIGMIDQWLMSFELILIWR